jgi:hypothetical protein
MRDARLAALTGKAGEHTVASQLLLRGVIPHWPAVDVGCDLITDFNCRVQVRCAHLYHKKSYGPLYFFPMPKTRRLPNSDKTTKLVTRKTFVQVCDFLVFWGIEQNRFWIVPASLCDQVTGVELGLDIKQRPKFVGSIKDMREMVALGYSRGQVAKHFGIQRTSLQQFLDSGKDTSIDSVASQMRNYESRWDLILNFGQPAALEPQAPALAEEPIDMDKEI